MKYKVLNQIIEIIEDKPQEFTDILERFSSPTEESSQNITIRQENIEHCVYGIEQITDHNNMIYNIFFSQKDCKQLLCALNQEYTEFLLSTREKCSEEVFLELSMVAFYSYMSLHNTLLMHASAVSYENKGIVFTAASGVGKTTQAELWKKYKGATILNGDKVFLKQENESIHAWGSPWKGSSPYSENESVPLKAIVVLEQAEENRIQKLEGLEVLQYVVPHIFFPSWDTKCEQNVLTFLNKVLEETEVYLLKCRPEETAVELLASIIEE